MSSASAARPGLLRIAAVAAAITAAAAVVVPTPADSAGLCGPLDAVVLPGGIEVCTHGPDRHLQDLMELPVEVSSPVVEQAPARAVEVGGEVVDPVADASPVLVDDTAPASVAADLGATGGIAGTVIAPRPASDDVARSEAETGRSGALPFLPPVCDDGTSGSRAQAIAVDVAGSDFAPASDADVRRWVGQADWTFAASAERDGGDRRLRLVTESDGEGCRLQVVRVALTAEEGDGFAAIWSALAERGFNQSDRKYLVFANVDQRTCGVGSVTRDDQPGFENLANQRVGYAQVNAPCWAAGDNGWYSVLAHEITHNLGGVQPSAPNGTDGFHCTDEWDVMCYSDAGQQMQVRCDEQGGAGEGADRLLDCNGDDYFNAGSRVGGHLADHWNVADSQFLHGSPEPPAPEQDEAEQEVQQDDESERRAGAESTGMNLIQRATQTLIDWVFDLVFRPLQA